MKIIIVGAGIAGLSTYLHLRKHLLPKHPSLIIIIYESHRPHPTSPSTSPPSNSTPLSLNTLSSSTALVGGGLGISPNGMRVLRSLSPSLRSSVAAQGFPVDDFVFRGANGWVLGVSKTGDGMVRGEEGEEEEVCVASSRQGVWEVLRGAVGEGVVKYERVVGVERIQGDGKVKVRVVDGEGREGVDEADLVVGADGVKSVVRGAVFGDGEEFRPTYTGLSGIGGFINTPIPPSIVSPPSMVFTFGRNGFFGYSSASPPTAQSLMWWSTFETSSLPSSTIDPVAVKAALVQRHCHWRDPIVRDIIAKAEVQSIYPTWVLDELPSWGEKGMVLVGDAAHAMDPTTGQGASQALEDSQTLALLLKEVLTSNPTTSNSTDTEAEKINLAIELFHEIRQLRVHEIVERGKKISGRKANVGIVAEYFMYFFLWVMMAFPSLGKLMLGDVNRKLYTWSAEEEIEKALKKRGLRRDGIAT